MDSLDLQRALDAVQRLPRASGIGTLGERTLHAVLKHLIEPDISCHEKRIGSFVADIARPDGIVEIQTRGMDRLRRKLDTFLEHSPVTVVYPIASVKYLVWINPASGETTARRKSPRRGTPLDAFGELYKIKSALCNPRLSICLLTMEMEEYRLKNGWSSDGKKGSTRCERLPLSLEQSWLLQTPADYAALLPQDLPLPFTSRELCERVPQSRAACQTALHVLHAVGAVERVGKRSNSYLYRPVDLSDSR